VYRVLQLTYRVPFPPTDGGAIGIFNITKGLKENGCDIDLVAINTPKHSQPPGAMSNLAQQHDVFVDTRIRPLYMLLNLLFSKEPYNTQRFYSQEVVLKLKELLTQNHYHYIHVDGAFVARYITDIRNLSSTPLLVRPHNIEYIIWERLSKSTRNPFKKWYFRSLGIRLMAFEKRWYALADALAPITENDKQRLNELGINKPMKVIPAGVVLDKYNGTTNELKILNTLFSLSALDWLPNLEGLDWFIQQIWPSVVMNNPSVGLHIAGKSTPSWMYDKKWKNTTIHGFVDDPVTFQQRYQLMLVPLLSGGGMRVKIVEGMAAGCCILSTSIGAEGIACEHGKNILIANSPEEWIEQINWALSNPEACLQIGNNARLMAQTYYENKSVTSSYLQLISHISAIG
jgi:glycosyltransferase involved in cell wall biosynthesis